MVRGTQKNGGLKFKISVTSETFVSVCVRVPVDVSRNACGLGVYEETWRPEAEVGCPLMSLSVQFLLKAIVL